MVIITVETIEDALTRHEKSELIARLTHAVLAVKGEAFRRLTWVKIDEIREGNLGVGGVQIHAPDLQRVRDRLAVGHNRSTAGAAPSVILSERQQCPSA